MRFVVDASVAATWCFADEDDDRAQYAFEMLASSRATALTPALFWFEIRNALLVGIRKGRIDSMAMVNALHRIDKAEIFTAIVFDEMTIFKFAIKHSLTFYDACYLELAQREGIALATLDRALARAATAEGIVLIGAS